MARFSKQRRRFLGYTAGLCAAAGGGYALYRVLGGSESVPENVNVVIFLIDTLRADRIGAYGYSKPTCPAIDALAKESVVFEQCNSPAPWTLPSVVSILTSKHVCEHGVVVDGQKIGADIVPMAQRLKSAGYSTCSLLVNGYPGPMSGLDRGYDLCWLADTVSADGVRTVDGRSVEKWLDEQPAGPYHFYIHNVEPHNPFLAPQRLVKLFGEVSPAQAKDIEQYSNIYRSLARANFKAKLPMGTIDNSDQQKQAIDQLNILRDRYSILYDAAVRQADESVASVIESLKKRNIWDDTLFILISDHGEEFGEHGGWLHDQSVYEELVHVPMIIRFPKNRFASTRVKDTVNLIDLMPTVFDYLGKESLMAGLAGRSLMPLVKGKTMAADSPFEIGAMRINKKKYYRPFKETRGDINLVVRRNSLKGIYNAELDTFELYDLAKDPAEKNDLSASRKSQAQAMKGYAKVWLDSCLAGGTNTTVGGLEGLDEETLQRLRALGYVD